MKPYHTEQFVTLYHGDARDVLSSLPDGCVHAVITDPPYGYGVDTWDTSIDVDWFFAESTRLCTGFVAVFGQLPSLARWIVAAEEHGYRLKDHIVWAKRTISPFGARPGLRRTHESIAVFQRGTMAYYESEGPYEDIKLPGLLTNTYTIEGLDRYIKALWQQIRTGKPVIHSSGTKPVNIIYNDFAGRRYERNQRETNFTNLWSFLPENISRRGNVLGHPTQKPVQVMQRLVSLLSGEDHIVLDPFAGSGTTGIAARLLERRSILVEMEPVYCEMVVDRLTQSLMPLFGTETIEKE